MPGTGYFDGTEVEANADFDSLVPRFYHDAKTLSSTSLPTRAPPDEPRLPHPICRPRSFACRATRTPTDQRRRGERPGACSRSGAWTLTGLRIATTTEMSERRVSTTDPDATPMRTGARTTLGYHDHYVVDGGTPRIILAAFVTPADVTDNMPMRDLLWRVCFRRKIWPHHVTGDAKYGTDRERGGHRGRGDPRLCSPARLRAPDRLLRS